MKTYKITFGSGLAWVNQEIIEVEDFECEQNAVDMLIDKLEAEGNAGQLIPFNEVDSYAEDQYVVGGNHNRCLLHYGDFRIEELISVKKTFNVSIREVLIKSVAIEAENIEQAKEIAKQMYDNEEVVLDYSDFVGDVDVKVFDEKFNPLEGWDENFIR